MRHSEVSKKCQRGVRRDDVRGARMIAEERPPVASAARDRQVSGTTAAPSLYPQGERETEANLDSSLEDQVVQKVVVDLINAIYEQDFLDCSYGFRPGRSQHQALDEVRRVICTRPTGWILELDIQSYFDKIVRGNLIEMVEKRVSDGSVLRLIQKWIKVGVIEDGELLVSETGTGQGQPISPLLANIYLHHALDVWFEDVVKPRLKRKAYEIRFLMVPSCFQHGRTRKR